MFAHGYLGLAISALVLVTLFYYPWLIVGLLAIGSMCVFWERRRSRQDMPAVQGVASTLVDPHPPITRFLRWLAFLPTPAGPVPHGVVLGRQGRGILTHDGEGHVFVAGAPGSGKTSSVIVPTLFAWRQSLLVYDPKRELAGVTSAWRSTFSDVFILDFTDGASSKFNPLDHVRFGTADEVADVYNITAILTAPADAYRSDAGEHFRELAEKLLLGIILHAAHSGSCRSFADVSGLLARIAETLPRMKESAHRKVAEIGALFGDMAKNAPREFASIVSTAGKALRVFDDPRVSAVTSASDFSPADIVCGDRPVTVYLQVSPEARERLSPIIRLLLMSISKALLGDERTVRGRPKRHELLCAVDEFAQLGRSDFLIEALSVGRSYGQKVLLSVHSPDDLAAIYGKLPVAAKCKVEIHCNVSAEYAPKLSARLGTVTEMRRSVSYGRSYSSTSWSPIDLPRFRQEELTTVDPQTQLVLVENRLTAARKIRWWNDPAFADMRAADAADSLPEPLQPLAPEMATIAELLDNALRVSGLTQKELAARIGRNPSELSRWKAGSRQPTPEDRAALESLLSTFRGKAI